MLQQYCRALVFIGLLVCPSYTMTLFGENTARSTSVSYSGPYVDLGVGPLPVPIPYFGIGYRLQQDHHGTDLSLQCATIVEVTQVKASTLYLHYFKPDLHSQCYVGTGLGMSELFIKHGEHHQLCVSPEIVFGKQYQNEAHDLRFFQAQMSWPTFVATKSDLMYLPLVVFSYGICF